MGKDMQIPPVKQRVRPLLAREATQILVLQLILAGLPAYAIKPSVVLLEWCSPADIQLGSTLKSQLYTFSTASLSLLRLKA